MGRKRVQASKISRQKNAQNSQEFLYGIVEGEHVEQSDALLKQNAATHLMKISRRHRLRLPPQSELRICKSCWISHRQADTLRVRIKHGQRIVTCLQCQSVRRFGAGPYFHRLG